MWRIYSKGVMWMYKSDVDAMGGLASKTWLKKETW
jgi:hypothetical protein